MTLDKRRGSSSLYSPAGIRNINIMDGFVCAGTCLGYLRGTRLCGSGISSLHGTRLCGNGMSRFSRDHGIRKTFFSFITGPRDNAESRTIPGDLSSRENPGEGPRNCEYRYLLRVTIGGTRGVSIGIVSKDRVRTAAMIAYCVASMLVQVFIGCYLGHQLRHQLSLKMILSMLRRLSFEQYLYTTEQRRAGTW